MRAVSPIVVALLAALAGGAGTRPARADPPPPAGAPPSPTGSPAAAPSATPPDVTIPSFLTLDAALDLLRRRGLDVLVADAAVRTAEANVQTAAAIANPQASFSTGPMLNYSASGPGCTGCSREVVNAGVTDGAALVDALVGRRLLRAEVARDALAAARLSRADALRKLEFQVKQQYAQIILQAETLALDLEIQKSLEATLKLSRLQYPRLIDEGGLARVEVQKLEGDQALSSDVQTLRQAKVGLAFLLGVRRLCPDFEVDREALKFRVPGALDGASPAALLQRAVAQRPDVAALGYQRLRADAGYELAQRGQVPAVTLGVEYSSWGTGQAAVTPPNLMGQVQATLPVFYQQQGELRRARADRDTQALQHAKALALVASDVETAFAAYKAYRELIERMEGGLLARAKTARDIVETQYRAGTLTLSDFLDSQRTFVATRQEHLNDLFAYWRAVFQLEQAVNGELRR